MATGAAAFDAEDGSWLAMLRDDLVALVAWQEHRSNTRSRSREVGETDKAEAKEAR